MKQGDDMTQWDLSVLYVEDDEAARGRISEILRRRVRTLQTACNGEEGLLLCRRHRPDVVLTDIRMPEKDGLQMSREIREHDRDVHIIVATALNDINCLMSAIDIGVNQFILKPIEIENLFRALDRCSGAIMIEQQLLRRPLSPERFIEELRETLARTEKPSGLLPVCASCKKVRDKRGNWQALDSFSDAHMDSVFSQGLCTDCLKKLYPGYYAD